LLTKLRNVVPEARITTIGQIVSTQLETNRMLQSILYAFLLIIVVVGAISIGNYMWSNVNERKKEIGVLRLIGYSKQNIYFMLLSKAAILGCIGGITGYLAGSLAALWLGPMIVHIDAAFIAVLLPAAMLIAIVTAVLGSIIPAWKAGKIEPFTNLQEV
jgi:putative ABC transport system permease protein